MTILTSKRVTAARVAAAGLAAVLLIGCGQDSPEKLMASAKEHLSKGDRNTAVIQLKNLLKNAPDNGEARLLLGQALLDAEDFLSAEKELFRALELRQPYEKVLPLYVRAMMAQAKYQTVVTEVAKYKLFNAQAVAITQTAVGEAHLKLGNRSGAREAYAAALAALPGYPRARLGEAMLAAFEGRIDDALKQIDEVIAAEPNLAEASAFRADILLAKGDRDGAKKALEATIIASDRYLPARLTLISMLTEERDYDAAAKLIESTRKLAPRDVRVDYVNASLAFRRGDMAKAREHVQQVLKRLPEHVPSLALAGAIELQEQKMTAAEASLSKALAHAPNHIGARQLLVQTYLRSGQPTKAKEALQPLVDGSIPKDPRLQLLAGETYLANGDVRRATEFYQAAARSTDMPRIDALTRLGEIALATGRSEDGFKELEAASELDAGAYQADLAIIAGHLRRNEFDKAMVAVHALEKKQPRNPLTFQISGMISLARKDMEAARRSFERALEFQPNYLPAAHRLAELDILAKRPEDARKRYEAMIAKEPNNEHLYIALAEVQARTGAAPKEIGATLQRAVTAHPQSPMARVALINFRLRTGDSKAALTAAQDAVAALPSDTGVLETTGLAQEAAGEINQAIATYNKLASLQPQAVRPLYRLAALYLREKDTDRAIESLRRVQKIAPRERDVVPQLVHVYVAAGRYDDAYKEAHELQKREPKFAGGFALEGDIHLAQGKYAEAERLYREALKRDPKATLTAQKVHRSLLEVGKSSEADAWAKKWIADNPKDVAMRLYLGEMELAARNFKAAAAHYQVVVAIDQNNVRALNNLAWLSGELNDQRAIGYAERAVKLAPNSAVTLDTYGMLLVKKGEAEKGLTFLERARKLEPSRNDLRMNYAKALIKAGKKDDARKELEALQGVKESFPGKDEVAGLLKGI